MASKTYVCVMCQKEYSADGMHQDKSCCLNKMCLGARNHVLDMKCYKCGSGYPTRMIDSCAEFSCGKFVCQVHKIEDGQGDWVCCKEHGYWFRGVMKVYRM